jgi:hypothetical protein
MGLDLLPRDAVALLGHRGIESGDALHGFERSTNAS